ncbi:hypothetical protein PHLCEN_2v1832 [Hermanssonia centrifuga]|uniref:Uncharacterized protein n=1 Tax=Hermanssonia centrifuga TaxID=98765 RepID=A0A2R6RVR8_9APHY|nr:hypothetical protein PHLCEN_2v1832 [Hermanssonia centrifuga]
MAQEALVLSPQANASLLSGASTTVEIERGTPQRSTDELQETSLLIGLTSCPDGECSPASFLGLGQVLFNGVFDPQTDPNQPAKGMFQDFLVTIPSDFPQGEAILTIFHVIMDGPPGGTLIPLFDGTNIVVNIV